MPVPGTFEHPPGVEPGSPEWVAWGMELRRTYAARLEAAAVEEARQAKIDAGEELGEEVAKHLILERGRVSPPEEWPSAVRSLVKALTEDVWQEPGWDFVVQRSVTRTEAVLFAANSEEGADNPHSKGDLRFPARTTEHFGVQAIFGEVAKFWATWDRVLKDGEGEKPQTKFIDAWVSDVAAGSATETRAGDFIEWRDIFRMVRERKTARDEIPELAKGEWIG